MRRVMWALAAGIVGLLSACLGVDEPVDGEADPTVAIAIAPFELPEVTDARFTVEVTNGAGLPVWSRTVDSVSYGDGAGGISYVGPCDADSSPNAVLLTIEDLYTGSGEVLPRDTWVDPTDGGPLVKTFPCVANADTRVRFDLTILRNASQGFFDIAVNFDDLFCSAKLDCGATTAEADDLRLLHDGAGDRSTTAVIGFACTAGPGADTHLYLDDVAISCASGTGPTVVDVSGLGRVDLAAPPSANPDGYLFGAAVYRGVEQGGHKGYWNVALGLDRARFAALGECTLTLAGTASDGPFDAHTTPADTTWPVIAWQATLSGSEGRRCTAHAVNASAEVSTSYTPLSAPRTFAWQYALATDVVSSGAPPPLDALPQGAIFHAPELAFDGQSSTVGAATVLATGWSWLRSGNLVERAGDLWITFGTTSCGGWGPRTIRFTPLASGAPGSATNACEPHVGATVNTALVSGASLYLCYQTHATEYGIRCGTIGATPGTLALTNAFGGQADMRVGTDGAAYLVAWSQIFVAADAVRLHRVAGDGTLVGTTDLPGARPNVRGVEWVGGGWSVLAETVAAPHEASVVRLDVSGALLPSHPLPAMGSAGGTTPSRWDLVARGDALWFARATDAELYLGAVDGAGQIGARRVFTGSTSITPLLARHGDGWLVVAAETDAGGSRRFTLLRLDDRGRQLEPPVILLEGSPYWIHDVRYHPDTGLWVVFSTRTGNEVYTVSALRVAVPAP